LGEILPVNNKFQSRTALFLPLRLYQRLF